MSSYVYGCGEKFSTTIPTRYSCREIMVKCGSTSYTGGVNQCHKCSERDPAPPEPYPNEGDLEWDHRVNGGGE